MKLRKIIILVLIITSIRGAYSMISDGPFTIRSFYDNTYKMISHGEFIGKTPMINTETRDELEVYQGPVHDSFPYTTVAGKVIKGPNKGKFYLLGPLITKLKRRRRHLRN